jgi:hypothetical protein
MNWTFIGIIILFVAYAVNRFVMTEATKKLDDSMKLKIFEVFSKRNNYTTIFLLAIVLLYFGAIQFFPHFVFSITVIYLIVFTACSVFRFVSNYKKLKQLEMPSEYIKSFIISYSIFGVGVLGLAFCVLWNWNN